MDFLGHIYSPKPYTFLKKNTQVSGVDALIKAYQLYLEQIGDESVGGEPVLSITRAWTLLRFVDSRMMGLESCTCCGGQFVVNSDDLHNDYVCSLCHVPSRAGKTKKSKEARFKVAA